MNEVILAAVGCACLAGAGGCWHYRRRRAWERRCSVCESTEVDRVIIMCPRTRKDHRGVPQHTSVGKDVMFAVFKFTYCRHCQKQVAHERHDKIFSFGSLRHKMTWQPQSFKYDPKHFAEAGIRPPDIDTAFDPAVLGQASFWEKIGLVS